MKYVIGILSILVITSLAWAASRHRKAVQIRPILTMLVLQFLCAFAMLNSSIGQHAIQGIVALFAALLNYAGVGINFVFGGLVNDSSFSFFFAVLMPIVFISALIGILQYVRVLGLVVRMTGLLLSKLNGMGKLESYNAVASAVLGQSEVFISIKQQIPQLSEQRLFTLCTSAMSTVSAAIIAAYMQLVDPRYVVCAVVLNLFGGFIVASLINPYAVDANQDILAFEESHQGFFEMLGEYILDGFRIAVIVAAMLVGFIAVIAMANAVSTNLFGISFQQILGNVFAPLAWMIGIPWHDAASAGSIMATKLISNEFVAMQQLNSAATTQGWQFAPRSMAILSVFLVSFANFGSIGIICGTIKALDADQGNVVARFGLRLLFAATLVSFLSATVVGLVF